MNLDVALEDRASSLRFFVIFFRSSSGKYWNIILK
jgi:hypothetical protein